MGKAGSCHPSWGKHIKDVIWLLSGNLGFSIFRAFIWKLILRLAKTRLECERGYWM